MSDSPTTTNGPLDASMLAQRSMTATFPTMAAAQAAMRSLEDSGIDADRIELFDQTPVGDPDQGTTTGLLGRLRDAVLPDDGETATPAAIRHDETTLTLNPLPHEVETAIAVLRAAGPSHFDADLERWRNAG